MSSKKFLIKRLMDYPEISNKEYLSLLNKKKSINNNKELNDINERIELYHPKPLHIKR